MEEDDVIVTEPEEKLVYFSSVYYKKPVKLNMTEIKNKLTIASNIAKDYNRPNKPEHDSTKPLVDKLHEYTKLPKKDLKEVLDNMTTRDRSFKNGYKQVATISKYNMRPLCEDTRSIFTKYYIEKNQLPTKLTLLKELRDMAVEYIDEDLSIQKLVKNKIVSYHHFPMYNRYILTEYPELIYKRTMYLRKIEQCRSQGQNLVYVELRKMFTTYASKPSFLLVLAAFPNAERFESTILLSVCDNGAEKWLKDNVLRHILPGSVVVLSQPNTGMKKLSQFSKKEDLLKWLKYHNVPHRISEDTHKSELYSLYKLYEKKVTMRTAYDVLFQKACIEVIHFPSKWQSLNFFNVAWDEIMTNFQNIGQEVRLQKMKMDKFKLKVADATDWLKNNLMKREENLIKTEMKIMKEDCMMETIVDNIMEMIKQKDVEKMDFPEDTYCDKTDYFETHIGDILSNC